MGRGPVMAAIRVCPSESRCFIAWSAPAVCAADTAGIRSFSGSSGSITTNR